MRLRIDEDVFLVIVVLLGVCLMLRCCSAKADNLLPKCESALSACESLQEAQKNQIAGLNEAISQYKKAVDGQGSRAFVKSIVVDAAAGGVGGALGGGISGGKTGLIVGCAVGGAVGALVGWGTSK